MIRSSKVCFATELTSIGVNHCAGLDELERYVTQDERHLIIGRDAYSPDLFVSLSVDSAGAPEGRRGTIGVVCDSHALAPCVAVLRSWEAVLVSVNTMCAVVGLGDFQASTLEFGTLVHDIVLTRHGPLVQTEIGIVALDPPGSVRWRCEHDLLESVAVVDDAIDMTFQDGTQAYVDIRSGGLAGS